MKAKISTWTISTQNPNSIEQETKDLKSSINALNKNPANEDKTDQLTISNSKRTKNN